MTKFYSKTTVKRNDAIAIALAPLIAVAIASMRFTVVLEFRG